MYDKNIIYVTIKVPYNMMCYIPVYECIPTEMVDEDDARHACRFPAAIVCLHIESLTRDRRVARRFSSTRMLLLCHSSFSRRMINVANR